MLAEQLRSGLAETSHDGAIAFVDAAGDVIARYGDIERPFFIRSSAKPFQAFVSQDAGSGLEPLELAIACASHRGFPVHIALVASMLEQAGLDESHLGCPTAWPLSPVAARLVQRDGATAKRSIWHNCSGKHAGFLRACVAAGWPIDSYLDPDHPLQRRVVDFVSQLGGYPVEPVGVDGCGAPVLRTTVRAMAVLFSRLAFEPALHGVFEAMHRYPALVGGNGEGDSEIATVIHGAAKGGAAGCIGVAGSGRFGLAVKSWDGSGLIASLAAAAALNEVGILSQVARDALETTIHPPVFGGGEAVGRYEATFTMDLT